MNMPALASCDATELVKINVAYNVQILLASTLPDIEQNRVYGQQWTGMGGYTGHVPPPNP